MTTLSYPWLAMTYFAYEKKRDKSSLFWPWQYAYAIFGRKTNCLFTRGTLKKKCPWYAENPMTVLKTEILTGKKKVTGQKPLRVFPRQVQWTCLGIFFDGYEVLSNVKFFQHNFHWTCLGFFWYCWGSGRRVIFPNMFNT